MTQEKFKMAKSCLKFSMFHQYLSQIFTKQVCVFCVLLQKERSIFEDFMGDFWHSGCCTIANVLHGVGVLQGPVQDSTCRKWFNLRLCYVRKLLNWDEYKQTKRRKYKCKRDHLGPYGPLGNLLLCKLPLIVRVPEMDNACRVSVWNFWVQISDILTACI